MDEAMKEAIKQYLKDHLRVRVNQQCGYYGRESIDVELLLDDKVFSTDSFSISTKD